MSIKPMQQKDALYYKDLIYQLRYYSKVEFVEDEVTKTRIKERENNKIDIVRFKIHDKEIIAGNESEFAIDLFSITATITKNASGRFGGFRELSKYPEIVKETIQDLEVQIAELEKNSTLGLKKKQ